MTFVLYVLVGFVAQLVDGALGMGYGVLCNSLLLSLGVTPLAATGSVHLAKLATTAASGLSHYAYGNTDRFLTTRLAIWGAAGGVAGALFVASIPTAAAKVIVAVYLTAIGVVLIAKALRGHPRERKVTTAIRRLGGIGGFLDAIGGGGWGPVVTGTLIARGNSPRTTIGSVNFAEAFVSISVTLVFLGTTGLSNLPIALGLMAGGVMAAPLAARLTGRAPARTLMILLGILLILLNAARAL